MLLLKFRGGPQRKCGRLFLLDLSRVEHVDKLDEIILRGNLIGTKW